MSASNGPRSELPDYAKIQDVHAIQKAIASLETERDALLALVRELDALTDLGEVGELTLKAGALLKSLGYDPAC
jgi:hypothetical protein